MAEIKIYGTLKNDTNEPIAYMSQVYDSASGKNLRTYISDKIAEGKFTLEEATSEKLGGIKLPKDGPFFTVSGDLHAKDAGYGQKGIISLERVGEIANTKIYSAAMTFFGYEYDDENREWVDPDGTAETTMANLALIGNWIRETPDAYSIISDLADRADADTLAGYGITDASISDDGTITLGEKTIKPLTEHQSLDAYLTKAQIEAKYATLINLSEVNHNIGEVLMLKATKAEVQALEAKVDALEYLTEAEAVAMVTDIFGAAPGN